MTSANSCPENHDRSTTVLTEEEFFGVLDVVDGDLSFFDELLELFDQARRELLEKVREALGRGDLESAAASAHGLKGSVSTWTRGTVWTMCQSLEHFARQNELEEARSQVELLGMRLDELMHDIRRMRSESVETLPTSR